MSVTDYADPNYEDPEEDLNDFAADADAVEVGDEAPLENYFQNFQSDVESLS